MQILENERLEYPAKIGVEDIKKARDILEKYRDGKANLTDRIIKDEQWYKMRHWEIIGKQKKLELEKDKDDAPATPTVTSAWLFNTIMNKHADAMDNFPIPAVLPREQSDEESAKILSDVLPVIMENNNFDDTYSDCWWDKLKHGTGVYGVFWNSEKDNGLGDIDIKEIDLLNIFWEPGISDIQDSRNLFIIKLVDKDILKTQYPDIEHIEGDALDVKHYYYDDTVDLSDKVVVVDWYYKKDRKVHLCKFAEDNVLYATENDYVYAERGIYDHGMYPVVFDVLYPEKGTPVGFGFVAIDKDPQIYIDSLESNLLETAKMASKKRFFVSDSCNMNMVDFADWNNPFVPVVGSVDDTRLKEIKIDPPSPIFIELVNQKVQEMKETSGNRDMNQGGSASGVTAAAAIAALQEAGNKTSRDMINTSYRAYTGILSMEVELIRQFYDEERTFRLTGVNNGYQYATLSNANLKEQIVAMEPDGTPLFRKPIFDYKMKAMKRSPFSRMEENERAKELYAMGFFNPEKAQEALLALDMMDFEGIETIKDKVSEGQTLYNMMQQVMQQNMLLSQAVGVPPMIPAEPGAEPGGGGAPVQNVPRKGVTGEVMESQTPKGSYTEKVLNKSRMELK